MRKKEKLVLRWREQGPRKGDKGLTVAEGGDLSYEVILISMSRILLANCVHEAETANSPILPCYGSRDWQYTSSWVSGKGGHYKEADSDSDSWTGTTV